MGFEKKVVKKLTIEELFRPIGHQRVSVKLALYSRAKKGKSHFVISAAKYLLDHNLPGFVYVIDSEGDFHTNASTWPQEVQDKIRLLTVVSYLEESSEGDEKKVDLVASIKLVEQAIDVLTDFMVAQKKLPEEERDHSIIAIDSASDLWEWLSVWIETVETKKTLGKDGKMHMMQTEWGLANKKYDDMMRMLLASNRHMILTFRSHQAFDDNKPLKYDLPKWQKNTDFKLNLIMEAKKLGQEFLFYFRGGRFGNLPEDEPLIDPSFEDILNFLKQFCSLEFYE